MNGMVLSLFNDNEKYLYVGGMFLSQSSAVFVAVPKTYDVCFCIS